MILIGASIEIDARSLREAGIRRVLLAAGDYDGAKPAMQHAAASLTQAGFEGEILELGAGRPPVRLRHEHVDEGRARLGSGSELLFGTGLEVFGEVAEDDLVERFFADEVVTEVDPPASGLRPPAKMAAGREAAYLPELGFSRGSLFLGNDDSRAFGAGATSIAAASAVFPAKISGASRLCEGRAPDLPSACAVTRPATAAGADRSGGIAGASGLVPGNGGT